METRDAIVEVQAGEHEEDKTGEDAGTGESIFRGQEAEVKFKKTKHRDLGELERSEHLEHLGRKTVGLGEETRVIASRIG